MAPHPPVAEEQDDDRGDEDRDKVEVQVDEVVVVGVVLDVDLLSAAGCHHAHGKHRSQCSRGLLLGVHQGVLPPQLRILLLRCFKGDVTGQLDHVGSKSVGQELGRTLFRQTIWVLALRWNPHSCAAAAAELVLSDQHFYCCPLIRSTRSLQFRLDQQVIEGLGVHNQLRSMHQSCRLYSVQRQPWFPDKVPKVLVNSSESAASLAAWLSAANVDRAIRASFHDRQSMTL